MNTYACKVSTYDTGYIPYVESCTIASGIEQLQDEKKPHGLCAVNYL